MLNLSWVFQFSNHPQPMSVSVATRHYVRKGMAGGMEQKAKGYALVLTSALMWGAIPLFTRYLYATGLGPLDVASVRSYLAAGMSVVLLLALGDLRNFKPRDPARP